jgi:hypothetical protein
MNKLPPELKQHLQNIPDFMKDISQVKEFVSTADIKLTDDQKSALRLQLLLVMTGLKDYRLLPIIIEEFCELDFEVSAYIADRFMEEVIEPMGYGYLSTVLKAANNEDVTFDPDDVEILQTISQELEDQEGAPEVPKPPKVVSPKLVLNQDQKRTAYQDLRNQDWYENLLNELYKKHKIGDEAARALEQVLQKAVIDDDTTGLKRLATNPALVPVSRDLQDIHDYIEDKFQEVLRDIQQNTAPNPGIDKNNDGKSAKTQSNIDQIRPKPHQDDHDPYREEVK